MDPEKFVKITNVKQFECLVQLMEQNKEIAKGYFSFGSTKQEFNKAWSNFAEKLNSLGPPVREGAGWQKVWSDFKNKIKKKIANNKKEITATGGGPCRLHVLPPLEESVSGLLCYEVVFDKPTTSFGLQKRTATETRTATATRTANETHTATESTAQTDETTESPNNIQAGTMQEEMVVDDVEEVSRLPVPPKRRKKNANSERHCLLEAQTKLLERIEENSKECARYARKGYDLKQKKLKMWHEFQLATQKHNQNILELKLRNIEYKEKKLAFEETRYRN